MKQILFALLTLSCSLSYAQGDGALPFRNTLKVELADTPEEIIAKAAHVVPTPRQWAAQEREFIAFVHFGLI